MKHITPERPGVKRAAAFIASAMMAAGLLGGIRFGSLEEKTAAVDRSVTALREYISLMMAGENVAVPIAEKDTLRAALYEDPIELPLPAQVMGRLTLEPFNLVTGAEDVNHNELRKAVYSARKVKKYQDIYFVIGAQDAAMEYMLKEDYEKSEYYYKLALVATEALMGDMPNPFRMGLYKQLALLYNITANEEMAPLYSAGYLDEAKAVAGVQSQEYEEAVSIFAGSLMYTREAEEHLAKCREVISGLESAGLTSKVIYQEILDAYGDLAIKSGKTDGLAAVYAKALDALTPDYDQYFNALSDIAEYGSLSHDNAMMLRAFDKAMDAFEKGSGTMAEMGYFVKCLPVPTFGDARRERLWKALQAWRARVMGGGNLEDMCAYAVIADRLGQKSDAGKMAEKVSTSYEGLIGRLDDTERIGAYSALANMAMQIGDYDAAERYSEACIDYVKNSPMFSKMGIDLDMRLFIAQLKSIRGLYAESLEAYEAVANDAAALQKHKAEASKGVRNIMGMAGHQDIVLPYVDRALADATDPAERWELLEEKANALIYLIDTSRGGDADAVAEYRKVAEELDQIARTRYAGDADMEFLRHYYNAGAGYVSNDVDRMLAETRAAEACLTASGSNSENVRTNLSLLSAFYVRGGEYAKAESLMEADDEYDARLSLVRQNQYMLRAEIARGLRRHEEARGWYTRLADDIISEVRENFAAFTADDRSGYWKRFSRQIQDAGKFAEGFEAPSEYAGAIYNMELFSKGLLLNSEKSLERLVKKVGNEALNKKYENFVNLGRQIKNSPSLSDDERAMLAEQKKALESEILKECREYGDYTETLTADWRDIRKALRPGEVAVEFVQYDDIDWQHYLGAAVVSPELEMPVFVALGKEDELAESVEMDFDASGIWKPIEKYVVPNGKSGAGNAVPTVYFSASGVLHSLPIESCPAFDADLRRLSSTRVLLERREDGVATGGQCVAFGGLDYGYNPTAGDGSRAAKGYLAQLPGTQKEVERLASLWPAGKMEAITGMGGTKERFLAVPHEGVSLLHIGTHGYFDDAAAEDHGKYRSLGAEERALRNCGLFFAGANDVIASGAGDSGKCRINSEELSTLDFGKLDLAVLSACETAAGTVTGEGVFGLQRGFKLAGAKSLFMSLWKVDDVATCRLMEEFYGRLFAGEGKHQALEQAKKVVKETPGWEDPQFWAAFVLLD